MVDEIEAGLFKLRSELAAANVRPVALDTVRGALKLDVQPAMTLHDAAADLNCQILRALTAADFRIGKAYRLGVALASTTLSPESDGELDRSFGTRAIEIRTALADLASVMRPHASRAVALSLRTWESWAADPELDGKPLASDDWAAVRCALRRQGQLWRALLSGEKDGIDMLAIGDTCKRRTASYATGRRQSFSSLGASRSRRSSLAPCWAAGSLCFS